MKASAQGRGNAWVILADGRGRHQEAGREGLTVSDVSGKARRPQEVLEGTPFRRGTGDSLAVGPQHPWGPWWPSSADPQKRASLIPGMLEHWSPGSWGWICCGEIYLWRGPCYYVCARWSISWTLDAGESLTHSLGVTQLGDHCLMAPVWTSQTLFLLFSCIFFLKYHFHLWVYYRVAQIVKNLLAV